MVELAVVEEDVRVCIPGDREGALADAGADQGPDFSLAVPDGGSVDDIDPRGAPAIGRFGQSRHRAGGVLEPTEPWNTHGGELTGDPAAAGERFPPRGEGAIAVGGNPRNLALALEDLSARRRDGKELQLEDSLATEPLLELDTDVGEIKVVPEPAGTRGYDDLRRAATREPLGSGWRPSVASLGDHARMLAALGREQDAAKLRTIRRLIELERQFGLGLER